MLEAKDKYSKEEVEAFRKVYDKVALHNLIPVIPSYPYVLLHVNFVFGYRDNKKEAKKDAKIYSKKLGRGVYAHNFMIPEEHKRAEHPGDIKRAEGAFIIVDSQGNVVKRAFNIPLAMGLIEDLLKQHPRKRYEVIVDPRGFLLIDLLAEEQGYRIVDFYEIIPKKKRAVPKRIPLSELPKEYRDFKLPPQEPEYSPRRMQEMRDLYKRSLKERFLMLLPGYPYLVIDEDNQVESYNKSEKEAERFARIFSEFPQTRDLTMLKIETAEKSFLKDDPKGFSRSAGAYVIFDKKGNLFSRFTNRDKARKALLRLKREEPEAGYRIGIDDEGFIIKKMMGGSMERNESDWSPWGLLGAVIGACLLYKLLNPDLR